MSESRANLYKKLAILLLIGIALLSMRYSIDIPQCGQIQLAPLAFICAYILATVLFLPGTILSVSGGVLFGPWLGTLYVSIGSSLGALAAFLLARYLGRRRVEKYFTGRPWFKKLEKGFEANSVSYLLFLRLSPIFPFNGLNYAIGLLPVATRTYIVTSVFGMLPGIFAYVYAGHAIGCAALEKGGFTAEAKWKVFFSLMALSALSLLPIGARKMRVAKGSKKGI